VLTLEQLDHLTPAQIPELIMQLGEDGLPGLIAGWALGHLASEAALLPAISDGRLDTRQNGYQALAILAARGAASPQLGAWLVERIAAEIAKAKAGGTGLAEQAARPLAILGHPQFAELMQRIIDGDRYCDRFELNRLSSEVADHGRARHLATELTDPWRTVFADHLPKAPVEAPEPKPAAKPAPAAAAPAAKGPRAPLAPPAPRPPVAALPDLGDEEPLSEEEAAELAAMEALEAGEAGATPAEPIRIDWLAFASSDEFIALSPQAQGLVKQLGPLLEQLSTQAIRAYLPDLTGQEFAALLLQVLPQALQPQAVQMALHPHALNGYQALAKWLARIGLTTQGEDLVSGVKLVRQQLRDQLRKTGNLGGPDYSDPDEAAAAK
jgi:hypothetical protein